MTFILWDIKKHSVGHDTIDQQHQIILRLINDVCSKGLFDIHSETLHDTVYEMFRYIKNHLEFEETILRQADYKDVEKHAVHHRNYLERVAYLSERVSEGNSSAIAEIQSFLLHWWESHILVDDMKYKPYLENI